MYMLHMTRGIGSQKFRGALNHLLKPRINEYSFNRMGYEMEYIASFLIDHYPFFLIHYSFV